MAMEAEEIPANLYFERPPSDVEPLATGRLQVVKENTPWKGHYAAVNSLSFTGAMSHLILKAPKIEKKKKSQQTDNLSRLVLVSGRTAESVKTIITYLRSRPIDDEFVHLIYNVFEKQTHSHLYRSFNLLPPTGINKTTHEIVEVSGAQREIWYVFSGMGSQWVGMGESLMKLPVFAEAVRRCDAVLRPHGIDIVRIITEKDPDMFANIIHSFVGIATIQIGLVDVLKTVGLEPDMIIGHSVGELGCAYADGCFTTEEMVLSALSRGLASTETKLEVGSMAAVGLGYQDIMPLCPPDIDVACHNGPDSATISGPADSMKKFVAELQAKGIFAREVPCSNIAYHSRYISPAGPKLMEYLRKVITNPQSRSKRWVSSSVPRSEWNTLKARLSSAEYHTNNLLSPVLFAETSRLIPKNAITIEIAPHGLLQAILRRSLSEECINIPLTNRGHSNNLDFLLTALGKLHNVGVQVYPSRLYSKIEYPVGRGTEFISPLIKWNHEQDRYVNFYQEKQQVTTGEKIFEINLNGDLNGFLKHHKIDGQIVLPCSLYLSLAWEILQELNDDDKSSIVFEDIRLIQPLKIISEHDITPITVMVQKGSGRFEVTCNSELLAMGYIRTTKTANQECLNVGKVNEIIKDPLTEEDVYTELHMRGFNYEKEFRNINKSSFDACNGIIHWTNNWTTFIDSLLQFYNLGHDTRESLVPLIIRKIVIDMEKHKESVANSKAIPVMVDKQIEVVYTHGVQLQGINLISIRPESTKEIMTVETLISAPLKKTTFSTVMATQIQQGDLHSITWINGSTLQNEKDVAQVEYAALNEHDLFIAKNSYNLSLSEERDRMSVKTFGLEFSGKISKNQRIMGICPRGTMTNYVTPDPEFTWPVPSIWTNEEAVTIPLSYVVAYAALFLKADIKKTDKILVHDVFSEYGQAIINIALEEGCIVYIIYNNEQEKKFVQFRYPRIPENHIHDIRQSYGELILKDTKGEGVDILTLGCNSMSKLQLSLLCAASHARVLLIGDLETSIHDSIGMEVFMREVSLYSVIPKKIANAEANVKRVLAALIKDGIESGTVKPLSRNVYESESLKEAFLDGIAKKNHAKIVIKLPQTIEINKLNVTPRYHCAASKSFLVVEGLSDFGLELVDWLITRGAKKIVLASETNRQRRFRDFRMKIWQNNGATVIIRENISLSMKQNIRLLLEETNKLGEIQGIFDLSRLEKRNQDTYTITKLLDEESKAICGNLQQFVVCIPMAKGEKHWQDDIPCEKQVEELIKKRLKNGMSGIMVICDCAQNGTDVRCLRRFDNVMAMNSPAVAVVCKQLQTDNKTLKHKQDTSNRTADTEDSEAAKFKAGLYKQDRYIADRFLNLLV